MPLNLVEYYDFLPVFFVFFGLGEIDPKLLDPLDTAGGRISLGFLSPPVREGKNSYISLK